MNNTYKVIEKLRQRPGMYIGTVSLTRLESFIGGYDFALEELGIKDEKAKTLFPLPFWLFNEYVAHHFGCSGSTAGWLNIILEHSNYDEQQGFSMFYKLFDNFKNLSIKNCERIKLKDENIAFHHRNKYAPVQVIGHKEEPLYKKPEEIYCIKLTGDAGYLVLINTNTNYILYYGKSKKQVIDYIKTCFGSLPKWEKVETGDFALNKELIFLGAIF